MLSFPSIIHHLDSSLTLTQFHIKFALRKTKRSRFSGSKHVRLSSAMSPLELKRRSLGTLVQMNDYSYSVYFYQYYSTEYEYTIWPTIRPK